MMTIVDMFKKEKYPKLQNHLEDYGVNGVVAILCLDHNSGMNVNGSFFRDLCFALELKYRSGSSSLHTSGYAMVHIHTLIKELYPFGVGSFDGTQYMNLMRPIGRHLLDGPIVNEYGLLDGNLYENKILHEAILIMTECYERIERGNDGLFVLQKGGFRLSDRYFNFEGREFK